jgi:hypothetical protein
LLTTDLPPRGSAGYAALRKARGQLFVDVLEMRDEAGQDRLAEYAARGVVEPIGEMLGPREST